MSIWNAAFQIGIRAIEKPDKSLVGIIRVDAASGGRRVIGVCEVFYADPQRSNILVADSLESLFVYGSAASLSLNYNRPTGFTGIDGLEGYLDKEISRSVRYYKIPLLASGITKTGSIRQDMVEGLLMFSNARLSVWIGQLQQVSYQPKVFRPVILDKRLYDFPSSLNEHAREQGFFYSLDVNENYVPLPRRNETVSISATPLASMPKAVREIS